ncbi:DNA alkylation repair protein [Pseudogemmobacter faecipullorum]|uniref:DNA alkylation repair protein n=1 Tax=Pseudogemmobacter faecipullorum TaxID=2755041 RepID=A0ABS8CKC9_9RHOB|nr:DNA alkylation repair protein [Pseudogemmobacter faecipullorum]MCB5409849.1 DNA alkylation repair protein [Pseudogemmobacter faecipullorum]
MVTSTEALAALTALGNAERAAAAAVSHKSDRVFLGVAVPEISALAKAWRDEISLDARLSLADALWQSDIHEARIAACRLLVQARITPDAAVWALITSWLPALDIGALADQLGDAGARRVSADPARLDEVESWVKSPHLWTRRAALDFTLPWAKMNHLKPADLEARERILGWAGELVADRDWNMQKALGLWIRDLSKHDAARARDFLTGPGTGLKSFARKLAKTWLQD